MTAIKIYARQVPPEYQESHLEIDTDYINLTGNRDYNEHVSMLFENARDALYDGTILDEWEDMRRGKGAYSTWVDALNDIIPPSGRGEYTRAERLKIPEIALDYWRGKNDNDNICALLSIITGQPWEWRTLRGCCQSDWVEAFYPANAWERKHLDTFAAEYFNTGTEWIIHDSDSAPETPEEIDGYSIYCTSSDPREEIAEYMEVQPEEVQLYQFSGYTRLAMWEVYA